MNLRSFFLAIALFLSVGTTFAVAAEPADEDARREIIYRFGSSPTVAEIDDIIARYFFDAAGDDTLTIILSEYQSIAGADGTRYAPGYRNDGSDPAAENTLSHSEDDASPSVAESVHAENEVAAPASDVPVDGDGLRVYDFNVSFYDSITAKIGFTGHNADAEKLAFSEVDTTPTNTFQLSDDGIYSILVFKKEAFMNGQNRPRILTGDSSPDELKKKEEFSNPYSVPLGMLFVGLGFGILLMIYTTAGKDLDD